MRPRQVHTRPRARCPHGLLVLALLGVPAAAAREEPAPANEEAGGEASAAVEERPTFVAPFLISYEFVESVRQEIVRLRVEEEKRTRVYRDWKRGRMWAASDNGRDLTWRRARRFCGTLELAGYDDWRLPTIEELEKLHVKTSNALYKLPPQIALSACCQWSSTRHGDDSAYNFSFRFRKRFSGTLSYSYELRALCVRQLHEEDRLPEEETKKQRKQRERLEAAAEAAAEREAGDAEPDSSSPPGETGGSGG